MGNNIQSIDKLTHRFGKLGGVGKKTALRYTYSIIDMPREEVEEFCRCLLDVKDRVRYCKVCGTFTEQETCEICATRGNDVICVVASPKDVIALERTAGINMSYHVLHGTISPLEGRRPEDLNIKSLLTRLEGCREVIIATNTDVEGEATAMYIARILKPLGIRVSRIAQGVSMGSDIEFVDGVTLVRAFDNRREL